MGLMEKLRGSYQKGVDEAVKRRNPKERDPDEKSQELLDYEAGYHEPVKPIQRLGETVESLRPVTDKIVPVGKKIFQIVDEATKPKEGAASAEARINRLVGGKSAGSKPFSPQSPIPNKLPFSQNQDEAVKRILGSGYSSSSYRPTATVDDIMNVGMPQKTRGKPKPKKPKNKR